MTFLILTEYYPSCENLYAAPFIHSRCLEYQKYGHEVYVISLQTENNYIFDGVSVFSKNNFSILSNIDIIMSHAPKYREHLKLLNSKAFSNIPLIVYFHGHEIMDTHRYYPKPYNSKKKFLYKRIIFDYIKLKVIKKFLLRRIQQNSIHIIFVSNWMQEVACSNLKLNNTHRRLILSNSTIIANPSHPIFLNNSFKQDSNKIADFITIRPFDNPKYAIDIVYKIALDNPDYTFHIYGKGQYFETKEILPNIKIFQKYIPQKEIPDLLNKYRYALMPTRLDSQGVMMCEIVSYGMPLITSNILICHEMLDGFNVGYIENNLDIVQNIDNIVSDIKCTKNYGSHKNKFDITYLVKKELEVVNLLLSNSKNNDVFANDKL